MLHRNLKVISTLLFVAMLLAACAPAATTEQPVQTVVVTQIVAGTPETVVITPTAGPTALPAGSVQINGAGATFPQPVYTEWIYAYQYIDPSVTLNYQGGGSGAGKKAIIDKTVDFAGSDSLLKDEEYTAGGDLQMYPVLAGAAVVIYNIKDITSTITLDRQSLVDIFTGKINKWNDPALVKLNPDLEKKLPNATITVVHRSDGSGTTEMFTNALASFDPAFKDKVGVGQSVQWPVDKAGNGIGGKGSQGVSAAVQNTPNSIGYVELSYAVANKIMYTQLVNKAGKTVKASAESIASAMNDFSGNFTDKLTNIIVDGPSDKSWPIAGYTYLILHTKSMDDCVKAQKLLQYINWTLTDAGAAKRATDLGFSVLPDAVKTMVLKKLGEVTCKGQPVLPVQ